MPILAAEMVFDRDELDAGQSLVMRKDLEIKYHDAIADENVRIQAYEYDAEHVYVPREYGIQWCMDNGVTFENETSNGFPCEGWDKCTKSVTLRDYQQPWCDELYRVFDGQFDVRAQAATGMGKTVMSLHVAKLCNTTTIVLVDQEFLRDQWIDTARNLFGMRKKDIGIVQGKKEDWQGKTLVVAMIQTLFSRDFSDEFYDYFGVAIFDEAHVVGAPIFARTLGMFSAEIRWGVSATPERGDKKDSLLEWHLGPVDVVLQKRHRKSIVRYVQNYSVYSWYSQISPKTGRYLNEIAGDMTRNHMIAEVIAKLYGEGRTILALSDRIEHLEVVKFLLESVGVPGGDIGVVARYKRRWRYAKDPKPAHKPQGWDGEAEFTPVKMQVTQKKVKTADLNEMKDKLPILLATYQMFSKGVDVPRIDTGIDMTPRSKAQQQHGRILRDLKGKNVPIWVTIRDINSQRGEFQFWRRLQEYAKSNVEVYEWRIGKGVKQRDPKQLSATVKDRHVALKEVRIVTRTDGRLTLATPELLIAPVEVPDKRTGGATRRKRTS